MSTVIVNVLLFLGALIALVTCLSMLLLLGAALVDAIRRRGHEHCACGRFDLSPTPEMSHVAAVIHCHMRHERDRCAPEVEAI